MSVKYSRIRCVGGREVNREEHSRLDRINEEIASQPRIANPYVSFHDVSVVQIRASSVPLEDECQSIPQR